MSRYALLYPFKPGSAAEAEAIFREGGDPPSNPNAPVRLISTTVFRKGDVVVRVFDIEGSLEQAIEGLVRAAELMDVGRRLAPLLAAEADLTTTEGLRRFFTNQMMEVLTHREAAQAQASGTA
jgi:hypothetical protein